MIIRKLFENEINIAIQLVWKVFLEYEAPDYSEEGVSEFKRSINDDDFVNKLEYFTTSFSTGETLIDLCVKIFCI